MKEQERLLEAAEIEERNAILFEPDTEFDERYAAVLTDMLAGRHASQVAPEGLDLI